MYSLEKRILEISYLHKIGHIGSNLSCVKTIDQIYKTKSDNDIFILSPGHMAIAWYVVIEKYFGINAETLLNKHGDHPNRDIENHITCSSGSLGLAATIAVGYAVADKEKTIHCLISDGECAEGSIWESLRFVADNNIKNIIFYVISNGYSAISEINIDLLYKRLLSFLPNQIIFEKKNSDIPLVAEGLSAHYHILNKEDYEKAIQYYSIQ
jgi:transketolase